ncbi:MAG: DNA-binding protein Alba [Candidatus Binatia bacterium]
MSKEGKPSEEHVVYVGRKPTMNYVLAVITAFNMPDVEEVVLKARGRAISRAVDVAEIVRRRFLGGVKVGEIEIGSEDIAMEEINRTRTVSTMEITLKRAKPSKGKAGNE